MQQVTASVFASFEEILLCPICALGLCVCSDLVVVFVIGLFLMSMTVVIVVFLCRVLSLCEGARTVGCTDQWPSRKIILTIVTIVNVVYGHLFLDTQGHRTKEED